MWYLFFLQNAHFGINLFGALVTFSVSWLFFDAYVNSKNKKDILRSIGFAFVSVSFLIHAVFVESHILGTALLPEYLHQLFFVLTRIVGYATIIVSLLIDPIMPRPKYNTKQQSALFAWLTPPEWVGAIIPVLSGVIFIQYLRRATTGLERHLKPVAYAFGFLTACEIVGLATWFRGADDNMLYEMLAPFGPIWLFEHLLLLVGLSILGKWIFTYLLKRLVSQLFIIMSISILTIFIIISIAFTAVLVGNIEHETLKQLETDARVLEFAFDSKRQETLADAQVFSQNVLVQASVAQGAKSELADVTEQFLLTKKQSTLIVVDKDGRVLARGEDRERVGDSLSSDPLVKRALSGQAATSVVTTPGVASADVSVRSAVPLMFQGQQVGVVMTGVPLDNAFVDSVKAATGLEVSVYADNLLSATTLSSPGSRSRPVGVKEEDQTVKTHVLVNGKTYKGRLLFLNRPYFVALLPLTDIDNAAVGMLSISKPQSTVLDTAAKSIEITFLVTAVLLALSVVPIYLISKNISRQFS